MLWTIVLSTKNHVIDCVVLCRNMDWKILLIALRLVILRKLAIIVNCMGYLACSVASGFVDPIIRAYRDGTDWMCGSVVYLHIHLSYLGPRYGSPGKCTTMLMPSTLNI